MDTTTEKLIVDNLKLVPFIFNRYYQRFLNSSYYEEIMGLGYVGLVRAAKSYDGQYRFTTWASYYIRREINKYFESLYRDKRQATVVSLDEPLIDSKGRETYFHEVTPDPKEAGFKQIENQQIVNELFSILPEREKLILQLYFGFGCEPMSTSEIGKLMGVQRQRVSQIIIQALKRMKQYLRVKGVKKADLIA